MLKTRCILLPARRKKCGFAGGGGTDCALQAIADLKGDNEDQNVGVLTAAPRDECLCVKSFENAGGEGSVVSDKVWQGEGSMVTMRLWRIRRYAEIILDPAKVTRTALQSAGSIAGLMITTECMVTEHVDENAKPAMPRYGWVWVVWVEWG